MHRGCFVWTLTQPLSGRRTPRLGPARVCVCVPCLAGSGKPAFRARCGLRHLFLWPVLLRSLFARHPLGWGCPLFLLCASVVPGVLCVRTWAALGLGVLLPYPSPPFPPPFFFRLPPLHFFLAVCALVVSGVLYFPARGALGLGVFLSPPPPLFPLFFRAFFFLSFFPFYCPLFPGPLFFFSSPAFFFFFFFSSVRPRCLWRSVCAGPEWLGTWRLVVPPAPPPFVFFPSFLFFFPFFLVPACRWCGAGLVCVSWAVGCAGVCFSGAVPVVALCAVLSRPSGAGWCCVVLPVVFRCLLFGLTVLCCLLVGLRVVFQWCCPCLAAWLAALWFGVVCLGAPLPCVVFCGAVLSCGGVLLCSAFCFRRWLCLLFVFCRCASVVCVLGCRAVCSLSSAPCAVLCCAVLVPLRCAVRVVCAVSGAWCCWFLVSLRVFGGPPVALVAWRCRLVACVGLGVPVWPLLPSLGVFSVVSSSPVLCPVALCRRVVLCCGALSFFSFALLVALVACFP